MSGSSDISADNFVAQFQEKRTLYWLRKVRAEKMDECLKNIRPVPAPRSSRPTPSIPPPYVAPLPRPAHSLPVFAPHQPHGPPATSPVYSHMPHPAQSVQPYHQAPRMPMPGIPPQGHPFNPAAPFASYSGQMPVPQQRPVAQHYANHY